MLQRFSRRNSFAVVLGLLLPGLGHCYWKEYLFGLFVLLVMTIASVLAFFSFLAPLPLLLKVILFGLPAIFYLFSFVDLIRSIRRKRAQVRQTTTKATVILIVAVASNLLLPLSPTNFLIRNRPELGTCDNAALVPYLDRGDWYLVDRTAYRVDLFFLDDAYVCATPDRWDLIAFEDDDRTENLALVVGLGGEEVNLERDSLLIDGIPVEWDEGAPVPAGEIPLTRVAAGSILVVPLSEGGLVGTMQISDRNIVGKVRRFF